jgi:hypothetical protein
VTNIKILVFIIQKDVVVFDADGLAKTLVAHLAAYALRIGSRRKYGGGRQCGSGSRHDRDRTHGLTTLANDSGSARRPFSFRHALPPSPGRGARDRRRRSGWGSAANAPTSPPAALCAASLPLAGEALDDVAFLLTYVTISITSRFIPFSEGRLPEASRKVERVRCPRVVLHAALGRLGYQPPGMTTGMGGASLDWDRRRRVTPVRTTSQEAWPEAEPLG